MEIQMAPELRIQQALGVQQAWECSRHGNSGGLAIQQQAWDFSNKVPRPAVNQEIYLLLSLRATIMHCMLQELLTFIN